MFCGFVLSFQAYNPVVLKNTPDVNEKLRKVQHLIRIKPVSFPYGLPKDESDYKHCFLNENGEFVVKHRIQDNSVESEQAWSEVLKAVSIFWLFIFFLVIRKENLFYCKNVY